MAEGFADYIHARLACVGEAGNLSRCHQSTGHEQAGRLWTRTALRWLAVHCQNAICHCLVAYSPIDGLANCDQLSTRPAAEFYVLCNR
jgi:hypothetical protein